MTTGYLAHLVRTWNLQALVVLLAIIMCASTGSAQSGAGSIQGTVVDPTGAVIPGALVQVTNQANGEVVDSKSNKAGFYQVPGLFTGSYTITVSAPNMKTYVRTLELQTSQFAVINASLTPGSVSQKVTVNADEVQLTPTASALTRPTHLGLLSASRMSSLRRSFPKRLPASSGSPSITLPGVRLLPILSYNSACLTISGSPGFQRSGTTSWLEAMEDLMAHSTSTVSARLS